MPYTIKRFHQTGQSEVIKTGLTLDEAREHCTDNESASKTATSTMATEYTAKHGAWFDGFTEE
jgi:hypothetical protein